MPHDAALPMTTADQADSGPNLVATARQDPHRPRFHFTAPAGWLNDPNGLSHVDGEYHLFYQYNPYAPVHRRIHWGHATSRDLVTWTDQPVALTPGSGPDRDGCWSGVVVDDGGTPTIIYSGRHGHRELPCVATGSPDLRTWARIPGNPVITAPPDGIDTVAFRDHCVWREGAMWRQLIGSGIRDVGGTAFLYESADLRLWTYLGPLMVGDLTAGAVADMTWSGSMWECIDLFRLQPGGTSSPPVPQSPRHDGSDATDGIDVLLHSVWDDGTTHYPVYWTGTYNGDRFDPAGMFPLDFGRNYFYAPQSMLDAHGRRIMFGWLQEGRPDRDTAAVGWSGVMSLPRIVTMGDDGRLVQAPAPELHQLRREHTHAGPRRLDAGERLKLPAGGDQFDMELTLCLRAGATAEVAIRATDDRVERTILRIAEHSAGSARIGLDRSASSVAPDVDVRELGGTIPLVDGEVRLRVIVDRSALEIFANGLPLTARIYPERSDATGVEISAASQAVDVHSADVWRMDGIWTGPRTTFP